ncbi:DinB family protein [Undibacterium jejuense]|uniref:DinB family protein n=1 Tax=Undibacterium jejuense TaxID=1344949 RepID=A0A923KQ38_9BURK|nr:DinB family protein [Undibacterium jejuense]MBC3862421.1 DinB family protein [Undibacterium jejuense]
MHLSTISSLSTFPNKLEELYAVFPETYTCWIPSSWDGIPSETFTAVEQICHIRDIEVEGYHLRLHRLLNEDKPVLVSIDSYQMARHRKYPDAQIHDIFSAFRDARKMTVNLLESLTENQWRRSGFFDGYGSVTVEGLMHFLCSHDQQHLAGLYWLLGQIKSGPKSITV